MWNVCNYPKKENRPKSEKIRLESTDRKIKAKWNERYIYIENQEMNGSTHNVNQWQLVFA